MERWMLRFVVFLDHFGSPMGWFDPHLGIVCYGCLLNSELAFRHSTWNWFQELVISVTTFNTLVGMDFAILLKFL